MVDAERGFRGVEFGDLGGYFGDVVRVGFHGEFVG